MKVTILSILMFIIFLSSGLAQENNPFFPIIINGKFGFIDKTGNVVITPKFDEIMPFSEGLALVVLNHKKIFIDKTGKVVIEPKNFEPINNFTDGLARGEVTNRKRYNKGYIDKAGRLVIDNPKVWGLASFPKVWLACNQQNGDS